MFNKLNLFTWNVACIKTSALCLANKFATFTVDICGISEHWLFERDLHFLGKIHNDLKYHAVSDKHLNSMDSRTVFFVCAMV